LAGDAEDRTESASARRLQSARDHGDVPVSRELSLLAGLAGGGAALEVQRALFQESIPHWFGMMLERSSQDGAQVLRAAMHTLIFAIGPSALGATLAVLATGALQTGFLIRLEALQPDFTRVSPLRGIKRLCSSETLVQALKSTIKLTVLSLALWHALQRLLPDLTSATAWPPGVLRNRLLSEAAHLLVLLAGAQALIALADLFWVRMQYAKRHRMSRQEQRDEHKDTEGNPLVRQRLRQLARNRARKRMMASVRRAAVVVTNPTHYAVALAYERGSRAAPRIVAKGMDEIALRIREEALAHRIPVVANPPLARALCRLELDTEIPVEHFKAVAEIVAYIWRMRPRPPL
jgi:flagellar biosynthetic protein FlhB